MKDLLAQIEERISNLRQDDEELVMIVNLLHLLVTAVESHQSSLEENKIPLRGAA